MTANYRHIGTGVRDSDAPIPHMNPKEPLRIDREIAARIRAARKQAGLSQGELARGIGVTFQQMQKYERAVNRIAASRLCRIARTLRVPAAQFLEGLDR